jgi:gas vesicle protein
MKLPWKYIGVSFVIGLLLGGSVGLYSGRNLAPRWSKKSPEMFLKRLDRNLHLTDAQKTQLLAVLNARRDKMAAYEDQVRRETRKEIRDHLMPDQQGPFDAIVTRHDVERRKREGR